MKTNNSYRPVQKPIKYKQFMQQLQNSSRSSNNDYSILSQRSFRQSNTIRQNLQNHSIQKYQDKKNINQKINLQVNQLQKNSYKLSKPNVNSNQKLQDVLYTFCDAKNTQKSTQIYQQNPRTKKQLPHYTKHNIGQQKKYFKTAKQKNEQKQNINFVNQIISKVQAGFEGKILKTQSQLIENLSSRKNSIQKNFLQSNKLSSSIKLRNNSDENKNMNKKIQSVKKILILSKKNNNNLETLKKVKNDNETQQIQQHNIKFQNQQQHDHQQQQNDQTKNMNKNNNKLLQNCSSKKKIVSLNINSLKNTSLNTHRSKVKLSLDKTFDNNNNKNSSFDQKNRKNIIFQNQNRTLNHSLQRMSSLQQSKIQSLHNQNDKNNMLFSGTELKQLTGLFSKKQTQKQEQILRLNKVIYDLKQKQKKLLNQINKLKTVEINKSTNHPTNQQKQLQILKKDCMRLTNSYKQVKKLYQLTYQQKQQTQSQLQSIQKQNSDLKQCLQFKKHQIHQLQYKIITMQSNIASLNQKLNQKYELDQDLSGLSTIIKQKILQYQNQISSLTQENQKLILIKQKLENYNMTLKQEIQEKDNLIWEMEMRQRDVNLLKKSCRQEAFDYRQNENKLTKIIKQLQSKLKLANIHNQYLTKQLVSLKNQRKNNIPSNSYQNSPMLIKFSSNNTLANTITTRNSSICYNNKDKFDSLMSHHINNEKMELENHQINQNLSK